MNSLKSCSQSLISQKNLWIILHVGLFVPKYEYICSFIWLDGCIENSCLKRVPNYKREMINEFQYLPFHLHYMPKTTHMACHDIEDCRHTKEALGTGY